MIFMIKWFIVMNEAYKYTELTSKTTAVKWRSIHNHAIKIAHKLKEMNTGKRLGFAKKQYTWKVNKLKKYW